MIYNIFIIKKFIYKLNNTSSFFLLLTFFSWFIFSLLSTISSPSFFESCLSFNSPLKLFPSSKIPFCSPPPVKIGNLILILFLKIITPNLLNSKYFYRIFNIIIVQYFWHLFFFLLHFRIFKKNFFIFIFNWIKITLSKIY